MSDNRTFAIWVTGLPASGKSTLVAALKAALEQREINAAILESDVLRQVFTPNPTYSQEERDLFYRQIAYVGSLLTQHGVPVIFDATANRRHYRELARRKIDRFLEIFLDAPLELCMARDPKGIYRTGRGSDVNTVPGLAAVYEPPENPDLVIPGGEAPIQGAERVIRLLEEKGYL